MERLFINIQNYKTNEPHKFVLNLSQIVDLKRSNKGVAFQNLSICYTLKDVRKQYQNNKLMVIGGFYYVPDIQDYIEYNIKNMKH